MNAEEIVGEAIDALSQEPVAPIKAFSWNQNDHSLEEMRMIYKRLTYVMQENLGKKGFRLKVGGYGNRVYFRLQKKTLFGWRYINEDSNHNLKLTSESCLEADDQKDFDNMIEIALAYFRRKDIGRPF